MVHIYSTTLCRALRRVREKRQQQLSCLSCDSPKAGLIISIGVILSVVMVLLSFFVGGLFLVRELDAVHPIHQLSSAPRNVSSAGNLPNTTSLTTRDVSLTETLPSTKPVTKASKVSMSQIETASLSRSCLRFGVSSQNWEKYSLLLQKPNSFYSSNSVKSIYVVLRARKS